VIPRLAADVVKARLAKYPAVTLVGPRQAGKTTLGRSLAHTAYFDLEQDGERARLDLQWDSVAASDRLVVLDEAQAWPAVFPRLRRAIDNDRKRFGRFLLLGSVSPSLMAQVSESLAGRMSVVELTPLLMAEMPGTALADFWLRGGFPDGGVIDAGQYPQWQSDYLRLLAQRDLPAWGLPAKPQVTERLLKMTAAVHGQLWNASQLGQSLGVTHPTVNGYLDYLEGAFLLRKLPPYRSNIRKRLTKSPRCYWRDTGLLHALLRVSDYADLLVQPWVGASWEGLVIEQVIGLLQARNRRFDPYFFRTTDGYEIDLLLDFGREKWAIEIKLSSEPSPDDFARLAKTAEMVNATKEVLISHTADAVFSEYRVSASLATFLEHLRGERLDI